MSRHLAHPETAGPADQISADPVATATKHAGEGRVRALDGLRALAVLLVMAGHSSVPYLERAGGPVGVTTFFVLSGFLITSMLVNEFSRTRQLGFTVFYWKRFVRLAPALVVMVALTTVVGLFVGQGWRVLRDAAASLLYVSNWGQVFWRESVPQLSITWSLAVEEQYYLLWPVVLLPLLRRWGVGRLWTALAVLCAASLVLRAVITSTVDLDIAYRLMTVNAFPLVAGGVLAAVVAKRHAAAPGNPPASPGRTWPAWARECLIGLLCAALGFLSARPTTPDPVQLWVAVPVTLIAVTLIWLCVRGRAIVLGLAPFVWIGRISYSLYLWHITFMYLPGLPIVLGWAISFSVAALSWRFVEEPARRMLLARGVWFRRPAHPPVLKPARGGMTR